MEKRIMELKKAANLLRRDIIEMCYRCGRAAHPGPALSCADIVAALYFGSLRVDPENPGWADRDRFILSKGHACPALYAALGERGYFSRAAFSNLRHPGCVLQGHPSMKDTPGVDMTSGSLGNGLGLGLGMAYYLKYKSSPAHVFVLLGDGELNEGTVWEAVMAAPALRADRLVAIVDRNGYQSCGECAEILPQAHTERQWEDFGWRVSTVNGHDLAQLAGAFEVAANSHGRPSVIFADTVKGKGVSFMEHENLWHQHTLSEAQYREAMAELEAEWECL